MMEKMNDGTEQNASAMDRAKQQLLKSFEYLFDFNGSGHMEIDMKILKRGQKEVMIRCGRCYRFVLDSGPSAGGSE